MRGFRTFDHIIILMPLILVIFVMLVMHAAVALLG